MDVHLQIHGFRHELRRTQEPTYRFDLNSSIDGNLLVSSFQSTCTFGNLKAWTRSTAIPHSTQSALCVRACVFGMCLFISRREGRRIATEIMGRNMGLKSSSKPLLTGDRWLESDAAFTNEFTIGKTMAKIPKILSRKYTPPRFNCLSPWFIWNYTCMRIHHFQLYPTTHIYLSIYLSIHPCIYLSMYLSIHVSIYLSVCLPIYLSICSNPI